MMRNCLGSTGFGPGEEERTEQAIGVAFNKRGLEGPTPNSPPAN